MSGSSPHTSRQLTKTQWIGFFALCLLWSSAWLTDGIWPSEMPPVAAQAVRNLVIAVVLLPFAFKGIMQRPGSLSSPGLLAVAGVCLLALPATLAETIAGVPAVTTAALFGLVPVAVILVVSYFSFGDGDAAQAQPMLVPALIGVTGVLLLLPFPQPDSWLRAGKDAVAGLGMLVAAVASVWMHRLMRGASVVAVAVICCLADAALFFGVFAAGGAGLAQMGTAGWSSVEVEALKAVCFDLPQILLLLWLLREVPPERFAARYLVVPMLTAIEGFVLMRPDFSWRAVGGVAMTAFGAWRLMTGKGDADEPVRMLG